MFEVRHADNLVDKPLGIV